MDPFFLLGVGTGILIAYAIVRITDAACGS